MLLSADGVGSWTVTDLLVHGQWQRSAWMMKRVDGFGTTSIVLSTHDKKTWQSLARLSLRPGRSYGAMTGLDSFGL